jgi:hypothetical protein
MKELQYLAIPSTKFPLAEVNLPPALVESLANTFLEVHLLPGNQQRSKRAIFEAGGRTWFLPRRYLEPVSLEPLLDQIYSVTREVSFPEDLMLPTDQDLLEQNISEEAASRLALTRVTALIRLTPDTPAVLTVQDPGGNLWRIPHEWRRRNILLPSPEILIAEEIPKSIAERLGGQVLPANFHPGSACCMPSYYRVFDEETGVKWHVPISACKVVGLGSALEHAA